MRWFFGTRQCLSNFTSLRRTLQLWYWFVHFKKCNKVYASGLFNSNIQLLPNLSNSVPITPKNIGLSGCFTLPPADSFSKSELISASLLQTRQRCTSLP